MLGISVFCLMAAGPQWINLKYLDKLTDHCMQRMLCVSPNPSSRPKLWLTAETLSRTGPSWEGNGPTCDDAPFLCQLASKGWSLLTLSFDLGGTLRAPQFQSPPQLKPLLQFHLSSTAPSAPVCPLLPYRNHSPEHAPVSLLPCMSSSDLLAGEFLRC